MVASTVYIGIGLAIFSPFSRMVKTPEFVGWGGSAAGLAIVVCGLMPASIRPNGAQTLLYAIGVAIIVGTVASQVMSIKSTPEPKPTAEAKPEPKPMEVAQTPAPPAPVEPAPPHHREWGIKNIAIVKAPPGPDEKPSPHRSIGILVAPEATGASIENVGVYGADTGIEDHGQGTTMRGTTIVAPTDEPADSSGKP